MSRTKEDIDKCCVCLGHYDDGDHKPKILLCSHTACFSCLSQLQQQLPKKGVIKCPMCRRYTPCPGGVESLMNNSTALAETNLFRASFPENAAKKRKLDGDVVKRAQKQNREGLKEVVKKEREILTYNQEKLKSLKAVKKAIEKKCQESETKIEELTETIEEQKKIKVLGKLTPSRCKILFKKSNEQRRSTLERSINMAWEKMLLSGNQRSNLNCRVQEIVRKLPMFNDCHWLLQSANNDVKSLLSHMVLSSIAQSGGSIELGIDDDDRDPWV